MANQSSIAHSAFSGLIGVGREEITPPVGIFARNWGAAVHETAEGIHCPLTATVLALRTTPDAPPCVLASLDLGWWRTTEDERFLRDAVLAGLGLDPARLIISLTHTHAGPAICREDADRPGGHLIVPYLEQVRDALLRAATTALQSARPATLDWAQGVCDLARNRDLPEPDPNREGGVRRWALGVKNPEEESVERLALSVKNPAEEARAEEARERLNAQCPTPNAQRLPRFLCGYNPASHADDTLLLGRVTGEDGVVQATLVNYACHPTTLAWENRVISPDFVGAAREVVERETDAPCLFLQGASGELAPRDQYTADTAVADRNGRQLGLAALSTLTGMLPPRSHLAYRGVVESGAPLAVWRSEPYTPPSIIDCRLLDVEVPLKAGLTLAEIEARLGTETDPVQIERLCRRRRITRVVGEGAVTTTPLWVWRLGDAFLVAHPNEAYSWLQTELRRRFPDHRIAVLNTSNGPYCGYLPPAHLYGQDLYAVWQTPFDRSCLERIFEAAVKAIGPG